MDTQRTSRYLTRIPCLLGSRGIDSKWTDSEGNIWYTVFGIGTGFWEGHKSQELYKLSKSATVMEGAYYGS